MYTSEISMDDLFMCDTFYYKGERNTTWSYGSETKKNKNETQVNQKETK